MSETAAVTVTFIRHGESTDNLLPIWAGWRDTPLSEHGEKQAKALADSFSEIHFDIVLTSTLRRAFSTGQAVVDAQPEPKPVIHRFPLLREQTRGVAEGHPWITEPKEGLTLEEHYAQGLYPIHHERWQKFPGGESLDDLAKRAEQAVEEVLMPLVKDALKDGRRGFHIAVASHGLLIAEMVPVLLRKDPTKVNTDAKKSYRPMKNTGWTRVSIDAGHNISASTTSIPLRVAVTDFNSHAHLDALINDDGESAKRDSVQTFAGHTPLPLAA